MKRRFFKALNLACFFAYNRITALFIRMNENKVLFLSESHFDLDGNLKAVYDALDDRYDKRVHVKHDRRQADKLSDKLRLWRDLTESKYVVLDDFFGLTSAMKLRKGQELVQLWHGCGAFKKFGFSRINTGDNIKNINSGYRKYTKVSVTAEAVRPCFAEAFDVPVDSVRAVGSPRTDMFFDEDKISEARERVYREYPQLRGKKIILIAPTYRGRKVEDASYDFKKLGLDFLAEKLGKDYHIVTKWHPALYSNMLRGVCERPVVSGLGDDAAGLTDLSGYGDINDILTITDILVTDFSSVIFDYFLLDKPVVYFIYDKENYQESRGFYFDFRDYLYGEVASDRETLLNAIKAEKLHSESRAAFNANFMEACDGKATERVIEWVFEGDVDGHIGS